MKVLSTSLAFCRLRGTTLGANNRLDVLKLVTTGVNESEVRNHGDDMLGIVEGWEEDETHDPDVPAISHGRGLTPFVFVSFEEVFFLANSAVYDKALRCCSRCFLYFNSAVKFYCHDSFCLHALSWELC